MRKSSQVLHNPTRSQRFSVVHFVKPIFPLDLCFSFEFFPEFFLVLITHFHMLTRLSAIINCNFCFALLLHPWKLFSSIKIVFSFQLFREASSACLKESLGWASSAFPTNDAKSRASVKPQILGKHKLPLTDSVKPPKSKSRKTNSVSAHAGDHIYESAARDLLSHPVPPSSPYGDPNLKFDYTAPTGASADDLEDNFKSVMDGDLSLQIETSEPLPHDYNPGLLSGLDDYSSLPEYTDIG